MGNNFTAIFGDLFNKRQIRTLILGLDQAGKTTILYKLKLGEVVSCIPTIGFNVQTIEVQNAKFTAWDVGGQQKIRPLWRHYYANTQALIFVVDSTDKQRVDVAKCELLKMLEEEELKDVPLLVMANKQDLQSAMSVAQLVEKLKLHQLKNRAWFIQAVCATTGQGLIDGIKWLSSSTQPKKAVPS